MFHIVDDNAMVREILAELIRESGHHASPFNCPVKYLGLIKTPEYVSPVAIFSDVKMPQMNGYDFMYQVKLAKPQQKFVMITGTPELEHVYKHLACMYLHKPFRLESLKHIVTAMMQCHEKGDSPEIGCIHLDNRSQFGLGEWECPNNKFDSNE
jgi:two-component SAPR family response regulator